MAEFVIALYLIVVGLRGNAGKLITQLGSEGAFVPFAVACAIIYFMWEEIPPPAQKPFRILIVAMLAGIVLVESSKVISAFQTAWSAISNLGSSSASAQTSNLLNNALNGAFDQQGNPLLGPVTGDDSGDTSGNLDQPTQNLLNNLGPLTQ